MRKIIGVIGGRKAKKALLANAEDAVQTAINLL